MEILGLVDIPIWSLLLLTCLVLLYIYGTYPMSTWTKLGVPGPKPRPFIGNTDRLYGSKDGYCSEVRRMVSTHGKICGAYFFRQPLLFVTDLEALKDVFVKDFKTFSDRKQSGPGSFYPNSLLNSLFFSKGMDWKRQRSILSPTFTGGKLKLITSYVNTTARQLCDKLKQHVDDGKQAKAKTVFGAFALDVIAGTTFGLDLDSQNNLNGSFFKSAENLFKVKPSFKFALGLNCIFPITGLILRKMNFTVVDEKSITFFEKEIYKLIMERKKNPELFKQTDFLQLMLNSEMDASEDVVGEKKLTTDEVVAQGVVFVLGGFETTSTAMQFISYNLAKYQDVQERVVEEIRDIVGDVEEVSYEMCQGLKFMEAVINETLRMYPPLIAITRKALKSTTLKGVPVPAGTYLHICAYNIGRDPESYENPDAFDPDRFMNSDQMNLSSNISFMSFGFGPRQCIGMRLAMMEMKIALVHMLRCLVIEDAKPDVLELVDHTGMMSVKTPIELRLGHRQ